MLCLIYVDLEHVLQTLLFLAVSILCFLLDPFGCRLSNIFIILKSSPVRAFKLAVLLMIRFHECGLS
jgi:hypothetical protein